MKIIVTSVASLGIGLAIGCYIGHRRFDQHVTNEAVRQMVDSRESAEALLADTSTRAISLIGSGKTQNAVELLSRRIARYYSTYATSASSNEQRLKLRAMIDELARTNKMVAAEIAATTNVHESTP